MASTSLLAPNRPTRLPAQLVGARARAGTPFTRIAFRDHVQECNGADFTGALFGPRYAGVRSAGADCEFAGADPVLALPADVAALAGRHKVVGPIVGRIAVNVVRDQLPVLRASVTPNDPANDFAAPVAWMAPGADGVIQDGSVNKDVGVAVALAPSVARAERVLWGIKTNVCELHTRSISHRQ